MGFNSAFKGLSIPNFQHSETFFVIVAWWWSV